MRTPHQAHRRTRNHRSAARMIVGMAGLAAAACGSLASAGPGSITIPWDSIDEHGRLFGGVATITPSSDPSPETEGTSPPEIVTIHGAGAPADSVFHVVLIGDGWTEDEMPAWAEAAAELASALLSSAPFDRFAPAIAVHRIDLVSAESGVDNDPEPGVERNTALDMRFWCAGVERLLCVNTAKVNLFAAQAPGRDLVVTVANSDKYGGAGYPDIATLSGRNESAAELMLHEIGHSLADLGDEYWTDGTTHQGPEPPHRNLSRLDARTMADAGLKWSAWLGEPAPENDGPVWTWEGGYESEFGVYRPSENSRMRSLFRPWNAPSLEALVLALHTPLPMVLDATPGDGDLDGTETLRVVPIELGLPELSITWEVAGTPVEPAIDGTLDLSAHGPPAGAFTVRATVVDPTGTVRNEFARLIHATEVVEWTVDRTPACPADLDGDATVGIDDLITLLSNWGTPDPFADLDGDGLVGNGDLISLLAAWGDC